MSDYHINVFYSEADECYIADVPDLDSCSAFGATPQEALSDLIRAKEAWLTAARATGRPIPSRGTVPPPTPADQRTVHIRRRWCKAEDYARRRRGVHG